MFDRLRRAAEKRPEPCYTFWAAEPLAGRRRRKCLGCWVIENSPYISVTHRYVL
jgi:hypothetical protein